MLVGSHIDDTVKRKIGAGEYIDFAKLMPCDKINSEEDSRTEMVNRGGMSYWVPVSDRENTQITSFVKWEQAFRVYSDVYNSFHPGKAGELIQYNQIIYTASQTFTWENVYKYDREFRMHMSRHHLQRSWGIILQQAWSMFLKDKVSTPGGHSSVGSGNGNRNAGVKRKLCFDYNAGLCTFGKCCKFDHRCSFCNKFGHGSHICRKANRGGSSNGTTRNEYTGDKDRWDKYEKGQQATIAKSK